MSATKSVDSYWRRFHQTPLKKIGVDASATIWGKLHLAGMVTIGDVIGIAKPGQFGIMDALIEKGCTAADGKAVAAAIGGYREKLGLPGEPRDDDQVDQQATPRQALREACEAAQDGNGKHPATPPDPTHGKSSRARRRAIHPEESVPEPAGSGDEAPARWYMHNKEEELPIGNVVPSRLNYRKSFDQVQLEELAASIKSKGLLQSILVRPQLHGDLDVYEIIFGERRYRAAKIAGLPTIRARIVQFTDKEVREAQIIENVQRADVSPLELADGYHAMLEMDGYTVETLAEKVGRSTATIRNLLKLRQLPEKAKKAVDEGKLPMSTAQLVARIPSEDAREKAAAEVLAPTAYHYQSYGQLAGQVMSFRDAKEMIERDFTVELKGAPFDRKSLDLVTDAGSCEACPKRTGNDREAYPDARADVCTDPACFRTKVAAHKKATAAHAEEKGLRVLKGKDAPKFREYDDGRSNGWVDLSAKCWRDPKRRTYKQLVGKDLKAEAIAFDARGRPRHVASEAEVDKALKQHGIAVPQRSDDSANRYAKQREKEQLEEKVYEIAHANIVCKARPAAANKLRTLSGFEDTVLRLLQPEVTEALMASDTLDLLEICSVKNGSRATVEKYVKALSGPELLALLVLKTASDCAPCRWGRWQEKEAAAYLKLLGIDRKKELDEARQQLSAAAKAEKGKKAKAKK